MDRSFCSPAGGGTGRGWVPRLRVAGLVTVMVVASFAATATATATATSPVAAGVQAKRQRVLYVTGGARGTVTAVSIDAGGRLAQLGEPVTASPGVRGVAMTPDGRFAYTAGLNGGPQGEGDVVTYAVQPSGELARLGEPLAAGGRPFGMAMAPGGRSLYATAPGENRVLAFAIAADGRLSRLEPVPSGGTNPRGMAVAPDGRHVYVLNGTRDVQIDNTLVIMRVRGDGSLEPTGRSVGLGKGTFASQVALTPDGRFLYAALQVANQVRGFRVGPGGDLTEIDRIAAPNAPEGVAMTPDGHKLYTASVRGQLNPDGASAVGAFHIRADGRLDRVQRPVMEGLSPVTAAASPDGRHLVVVNAGDDASRPADISSFAITRRVGRLATVPGSPFQAQLGDPGFQSLTIAPNQGPAARFSAEPGRANGRVVRFDARASSDPDGRVARFTWDFGDGTVRRDGGPTPRHHYSRPGIFSVRLTVTDNEGCADRQVFTGVSVLCNGTGAARFEIPVVVG